MEDAEVSRRRRANIELAKSQSHKRIVKLERDIYDMAIDAPNPEMISRFLVMSPVKALKFFLTVALLIGSSNGSQLKAEGPTKKILSKTIKDNPIVMGVYAQWLISNSVRKKALYAKKLARKLKDCVENLSVALSSTSKSISKPKTTIAAAKKAEDQATSKVGALNKRHYSADAGL